jgi:hypothetical protein
MFFFNDYQVDSLVLQEYVPKGVSSVVSISPPKWLNIVLDINGILCHCMEKMATRGMLFVNDVKQGIHSTTVPTIVGLKAFSRALVCMSFLLQLVNSLLVSSFGAQ